MGRHKDSDTLSFIDWLRNKGQSLGFFVATEYALHDNEYFVDLVWKLKEEQEPLVTFEIETVDAAGVFINTQKIFGPPSKMVRKPWRHFMIIYKTKLSSGHKNSLFNVINQHNISLYENVFNDPQKKEKIETELDNIAYDLSSLIQKVVSGKTLGESLPLILKGLTMGLKDGPIKNPNVSISITSNEAVKGNIKFNISTETSTGKPTFFDRLRQAQQTLKPFSIESPELKDFMIEGKSVFPKEHKNATLTVVPTAPIVPVKIIVPNTNIIFDDVMLRLTKIEGTFDYLSTEERNLPFVFEFILDRENKGGNYTISFEHSHGDVKQALQFEQLIQALNRQKELRIFEPEENKMIFGFEIDHSIEQNEYWYDITSRLAHIQEKTKHRIPAPDKINREDAQKIDQLFKVINTGKEEGIIKNISFRTTKTEANNMVDLIENKGKIPDVTVSSNLVTYTLFDEKIPLGPSKVKLPDMQFDAPLDSIKNQISNSVDELIKITLIPVDSKKTVTIFENFTEG